MKRLLPLISLVLLLTACYDKDIQEINNRLDNIENQKIASISEQIEAIQKTIPLLSEIDEQLSEHISSLEDKSNKEIAALKEVNATLKNQIAGLEKYVNDQLSNTTNWVNATFATLAQYNSMVKEISGITLLMNNTKAELLAVISQVETSMKSWVNEQLTGYYDIAEINAKLEAIDKQIKAGDEENAKALNELKKQLEKSKTELTEAYQKAITEAITNNNGVIDGKIASQIEAVNKRIDSEVDAMNTKIAALEARIKAIEDKLDEILNRKLDIAFDVDNNIIVAPNYTLEIGYSVTSSTNSATVEVTSSADIKAKVVTNGLNGKISITTGDTIDEYSKVIVFVSNGENVIMRSITFEQATIQINNSDTKTIPVEGGTVELSFLTNVECEVVIPSSASSWLSVVPATRALEERTITLQATANEGTNRSAVVTVKSIEGNLAVQYTINQMSNITILNYTTNDGKPLDPFTTEGFGAELAENSYDAATGKGFLKFNGKVTTIAAKAFTACTNLTWIDIPDCITTIGDSAFRGCLAIVEITIPSSIKSIGKSSFEGCGGKAIINCEIGNAYFASANFTEVTIGDNITKIENYAFAECESLTSITISNSVSSIEGSAFFGCTSLTSIAIPNSVTSIGHYAFSECTSLTSITIPDSVTSIEGGAFYYCPSLKEVYYTGDLSVWCKINFHNNSANPMYNGAKLYLKGVELTEVTIPSDMTEIKYAFTGCTSLTSITFHKRITSIGDYAFYNCTSLISITIPDSVTSIEGGAFNNCTSLTTINIPNSVTSIRSNAFSDCTSLKCLTIPDSINSIESYTFMGCTSLSSVIIPDSVTSIESYAFYLCYNLKDVIIGTGIKEIGEGAFYKAKSGTSSSGGTGVGAECNCQTPCIKVYLKATNPPILFDDNTFFGGSMTHKTFYVPTESVEAYKAASYWSGYADRIVGYDF